MDMQPVCTTYTADFNGTLDHILINDKIKALELLELPPIAELEADKTCPSQAFPSDHLRIEAKLLILKN